MSHQQDIRWKQWLQNFEKALFFLEAALAKSTPHPLEEAGIVQCYKFTFELAWRTLKDSMSLS
jgi:Nucleotidyltransferase substrate binding protein like